MFFFFFSLFLTLSNQQKKKLQTKGKFIFLLILFVCLFIHSFVFFLRLRIRLLQHPWIVTTAVQDDTIAEGVKADLIGWKTGTYAVDSIFRKHEKDWKNGIIKNYAQ